MYFHTSLPSHIYCLLEVVLFIKKAQGSDCYESNSVLVEDVCFLYDKTEVDFFKAKKFCEDLGIQLAIIDWPGQIEILRKTIETENAWTGANDMEEEGKWVWDDAETPVLNKSWFAGEPNNLLGTEHCAIADKRGLLTDMSCYKKYTILCSYRLPPSNNLTGENNLLCHCASGACYSNGTCIGDDLSCADGWFGPGCQYRSLIVNKKGPIKELTDNDDSTCTSKVQLLFIIKLKKGSIFTWMRIVVNSPDQLGGFKVYFKTRNMKVACQGMRVLPVNENDRAVDVICHEGPFIVDDVILSWPGEKTVCSVDINGDRNFAFLQNTSSQENQESADDSMIPVDGRRDRCILGKPKVGHQQWTMVFINPKAVNEITIHRKRKRQSYAFMNMFYIKGYDSKDVLLFHYKDAGEHAKKATIWIPTRTSMPLKRIVIGLEEADDAHYMELCEVEAFGACSPPYYGMFCDLTCDVRCSEQVCHHNGMCVVCAFGYSDEGDCLGEGPSKPEAFPCTPQEGMSEDSQIVKLLLVSCISFAMLVLVLIAYIIKRWQDEQEEVKEPVKEFKPNITTLEDNAQEKSELPESANGEKSAATEKTTAGGIRNKFAATEKTTADGITDQSAATEKIKARGITNKTVATAKATPRGSTEIW